MTKHWTSVSPEDFAFAVAFDFIISLENEMEKQKWYPKDDNKGYYKIRRNPKELNILRAIKLAKCLEMKVALVLYDDEDKDNRNGPVFSEIFTKCWQALGKPSDKWELEEALKKVKTKDK